MWKQFISDYLGFSKRDRTGILVLLFLIIFFTALPFLYPLFIKQRTYDHSDFEKAIATLRIKQGDSADRFEKRNFNNRNYQHYMPTAGSEYGNPFKGEMFYFDPNSASPSDWKRLGVRDKTIATIQNYLSKGGKFYKKEDIGKIWGLHKDEVDRLTPYVQIQGTNSTNYSAEKQDEKKDYKKTDYSPGVIDINLADTAAFIALPGIGTKLSHRIINFRDKLGGFYKVDQIAETFGLPDSTFQKIRSYLNVSNTELRRININTATVDEMKSHPYLRYPIANAIVQYRVQHGSYTAVAEIKKIMTITEDVFNKIAPYLTVN